jgi:hypothetical protein
VAYESLPQVKPSGFVHTETGFGCSWVPLSVDLDTSFKPAGISLATSNTSQVRSQ